MIDSLINWLWCRLQHIAIGKFVHATICDTCWEKYENA